MLVDNFILSLNVVAPIFVYLVIGIIIRHSGWLSDVVLAQLNTLIFRLFFPISLFNNVYRTSLGVITNGYLVLYVLITIAVVFFLLWIVITPLIKDTARRGSLIQGIFRTNSLLFAVPITASIYGSNSAGLAAICVAIGVPLYNVLTIILLETLRGGTFKPLKIIKGVSANPLIISSLLGLLLLLLNLRLPIILERTASEISGISTPLALMVLGATFDFKQIGKNIRILTVGCIGKLFLVPLFFVGSAIALGFRGLELGTILAMTAAPTAVTSYAMAVEMGADGELAAQIIVFTSAFSVISLFLWVFTLSSCGLLL